MSDAALELEYSTDIDYERLFKMSKEEVIEYAYEGFQVGGLTHDQFVSMGKMMLRTCDIVGLTPDNEQLLFVLSDMHRTLCESCAGSGKTTMSQMCVLKYKMVNRIKSGEILCLAYNKNAVADMEDRHENLVFAINKVLRESYEAQIRKNIPVKPWKDVMVDKAIRCSTIHAWSREWVVTFADRFGINPKKFTITEDDSLMYLDRLTTEYVKRLPEDRKIFITPETIGEILRVYAYAKETLTMDNPSAWEVVISGDISGLYARDLAVIFKGYEEVKRKRKQMDFDDMLYAFYDLLSDPETNRRIRENYKVLLVDEYQDTTPAMLRIIKIFAEGDLRLGIPRYDGLRLICVGDTDQAIYGYRGTDPYNCLRFKADYRDGKTNDARILSMSVNRRCARAVLDSARAIIQSNSERIDKPILGLREGGDVKVYKYPSDESQASMVIKILEDIPKTEWSDTCICFRNNLSSRYINVRLFEQKIAFNSLKEGQELFEDKISRLARDILMLFRFPSSKTGMQQVLYKLLPQNRNLNKKVLNEIIDRAGEETRFWELDLRGYWETVRGLDNTMKCIYKSYKIYRTGATLAEYMPALFRLYRAKDYLYMRGASEQEMFFTDYMQSFYSQPITIGELNRTITDTFARFEEDKRAGKCVNLSTFHGLKGLEYKHVIIIDLADSLFPGNELKKNKMMDARSINLVEKEARRLLYVAVTRAKDDVHLLFSEENPTRYIKFFEGIEESKRFKRLLESSTDKNIGGFIIDSTEVDSLDEENEVYVSSLESDPDLLVADDTQTPDYTDLIYEDGGQADRLVKQIFKKTGGTVLDSEVE